MKPLTVGMTPAFFYPGDNLLRAQLRCLSDQSAKDFDVLLVDPHYNKRKSYIPELAEKLKLDIKHVPYVPNLAVAKRLDCAVFNAPYVFSESPKIVRYSCWRFVGPEFTRKCLEAKHSVDFYFHNVEPPTRDSMHPITNHNALVWNINSDVVNWDAMPRKAGDPGASWTSHSDHDQPLQPFPLNCFGNYMVPREDWLNLNGCDEVVFSSEHFEDQDFCNRANLAGMQCERKAHQMWRLHHLYGSHSGRSNELPDYGAFRPICKNCEAVEYIPKPMRRDLVGRTRRGEINIYGQVWVCKDCGYAGPVFHKDENEYQHWVKRNRRTRSNIIPSEKLGRNLRILAADMDGKSLDEKVAIFRDSWHSERYYQP